MAVDLGRFVKKMLNKFLVVLILVPLSFLTVFTLVLSSTTLGIYGASFFAGYALIYYWTVYGVVSAMLVWGAFNVIIKAICQE